MRIGTCKKCGDFSDFLDSFGFCDMCEGDHFPPAKPDDQYEGEEK